MNTTQILLLCLAVLATLYQFVKGLEIAALIARYGQVDLTKPLQYALGASVGIQISLVLALTGVIA